MTWGKKPTNRTNKNKKKKTLQKMHPQLRHTVWQKVTLCRRSTAPEEARG